MVKSYTSDFGVIWEDPDDASHIWGIDRNHFAYPLPPLSQALFTAIVEKTWQTACVFVNGYLFMKDFRPPPTPPEITERNGVAVWQEKYLPATRRICEDLRVDSYEKLSVVELSRLLPAIFEQAAEGFSYPTVIASAVLGPALALVFFCHEELGDEGAMLAGSLLQGFANQSAGAGLRLGELAKIAAELPEVASAVRAGQIEAVAAAQGSEPFSERFRTFLDDYGWRAEDWCLAHVPTWAEDPSVPLRLIGRYLDDRQHSPEASIEKAVEGRDDALAQMNERLNPKTMPRFHELVAAAQFHVAVSEERAMWQLLVVGSTRVPLIALGGKLASASVIDEANDVFFLTIDEIRDSAATEAPLKDVVWRRKAELKGWRRLEPPTSVGRPLVMEGRPPISQIMHRFFFGTLVGESPPGAALQGNGASPGAVRARARVVNNLSENDRLATGEVLVCRTTSPAWTALFAVAGAVVTEVGGVLCHAAICAREYAIPCVVGVTGATARIPDGAFVTVDGAKGTVTLEAEEASS